jgi:hypothetical protein
MQAGRNDLIQGSLEHRRDDIADDENRRLRDYGTNYFRNGAKVP